MVAQGVGTPVHDHKLAVADLLLYHHAKVHRMDLLVHGLGSLHVVDSRVESHRGLEERHVDVLGEILLCLKVLGLWE